MPRTARTVLLDLDLEAQSGGSPANRLSAAIVARIADGTLADGAPLPSSRSLAAETGLPRSTVVSAYEELISAGYLSAIGGSGTSVAAGAAAAARAGVATHVPDGPFEAVPAGTPRAAIPFDLRPGLADTTLVDEADWRRSWRAAAGAVIDPDLPWAADQGHAQRAIASYLRTSRGVRAPGGAVTLAPGASAAFRAVVTAFAPARIHAENPLYRAARAAFAESGTPVVPVEVDADGLRVDHLPDERTLVYVTPAHQFPLGHRLSVERRAALVEWARRTGSLILEDDYDGEFRYDVSPLPALQSLGHGPDVVAYVGTASKILAPSLQAAWIVAPEHLRAAVGEALEEHRQGLPPIIGGFLADIIESGCLARTVARGGRVYRARRTALLEALHTAMPWCRVVGLDAGLHLVLMLPQFADDESIAAELATRGLHCLPLSPYFVRDAQRGLVLGYTRLPEDRAQAAASVIADVLDRR